MSFTLKLLLVAALAAPFTSLRSAEEKKDEKQTARPTILTAVPFALVAGTTNKSVIRGLSLSNATKIWFPSAPDLTAEIKSRSKANLPAKADPKKFGDTQLEILIHLPLNFPAGELGFAVSSPDGETNTNLLYVVAKQTLADEKEPNASFRKPNDVSIRQSIRGMIQDADDVDVFRFHGEAGQRVRIENKSVRYGSALDALLTLYDARGHVLATSDDSTGLDARIVYVLPRAENYLLAINDAHDRGGPNYPYLIQIQPEPPGAEVGASARRKR